MDKWTEVGKIRLFDHTYLMEIANFSMSVSNDKHAIKIFSAEKSTPQKGYFKPYGYARQLKYHLDFIKTKVLPNNRLLELQNMYSIYMEYRDTHDFEGFDMYCEHEGIVVVGPKELGSFDKLFLIFSKKDDNYTRSNRSSKVYKRYLVASKLLNDE